MLADERSLGKWIGRFKHIEGETNSKREQLMRRESPLIFA
jgi:Sec-independent protein translocase protein TatA